MAYWEIEPNRDTRFDVCVMPAETNQHNQDAREYAHDVLDSIWDSLEGGEEKTVTLRLVAGEMPKLENCEYDE